MLILYLSFLLFNLILSPAWSQDFANESSIKVVYPKPGGTIETGSTFLIGQANGCSNLTCNGENVRLNKAGFFAHVVSLHYGSNHFSLMGAGVVNKSLDLTIMRKAPNKPINANELKLEDLRPNKDLGVTVGDFIYFSVRATPRSNTTVQLADHSLTLSCPAKNNATSNKDVAYGKTFNRFDNDYSDNYKGAYKVSANDHFYAVRPQFQLNSNIGNLLTTSKFTISTVESLFIAKTSKNPTIVRLGPGLARTTPLVEGVRVLVDGWAGNDMRCIYSPNYHVWINKKDLILESVSHQDTGLQKNTPDNPAPHAVAQTINIFDDTYGDKICLPLTDRLPYQIEQKMNPNCLVLKVYGVSPDTDWITAEPKSSTSREHSILDHITWRQVEDGVYEITAHLLGKRQWGYKISYEESTLCLAVKKPPISNSTESLEGIKVCIDPGHGGAERGSIGCSGAPESQINLEIATKVEAYLKSLGATVIMTRRNQNENPSLDERVRLATNSQSDFLISIHNNALPDGRDPWKEHGTSSYWYHPQSVELAKRLKNSVKDASNFIDLGARYQNLALARGTAMPSVLLEIGFMINPDEFTQLIDPEFQNKIAQAIGDGLKDYLNKEEPTTKISN